jgi:hypothetical protein
VHGLKFGQAPADGIAIEPGRVGELDGGLARVSPYGLEYRALLLAELA